MKVARLDDVRTSSYCIFATTYLYELCDNIVSEGGWLVRGNQPHYSAKYGSYAL